MRQSGQGHRNDTTAGSGRKQEAVRVLETQILSLEFELWTASCFLPLPAELVKRCGLQSLNVKAHQRRGDAAAEATPVRCKAKQKAKSAAKVATNPAWRAFGLAAAVSGNGTVTRRATFAAEK